MKTTVKDRGRSTANANAPQPELQAPPTPTNPANSANPEPPDTTQARELMREVCILASMAIRVSRDRPGVTDELDDDDRDDRIQLLRRTLDRIGWVSDVALRKLGGPGVFARAEDWMLPGV